MKSRWEDDMLTEKKFPVCGVSIGPCMSEVTRIHLGYEDQASVASAGDSYLERIKLPESCSALLDITVTAVP